MSCQGNLIERLIYRLQMAYRGMLCSQIFLRIMNYIFSDLKQPEINIFSGLNLPKEYTFSDLIGWECTSK